MQASSTYPYRLIILDDDPTGIQTIHGCLTLTDWRIETIRTALADTVPYFFILTNTRALSAEAAASTIEEVVTHVEQCIKESGDRAVYLFRSDSTLRGHFPLELDTMIRCAGLDPAAKIFIPAFFEGGRVTEQGVHSILEQGRLIPCHDTEFAHDSVFPYSTSYLPEYLEEKSHGSIKSDAVNRIPRSMLEGNQDTELRQVLRDLPHGSYLIVDALDYQELDRFTEAVRELLQRGSNFVFQTAASTVKSLTQTPYRAPMTGVTCGRGPGLIVVGSHVQKTTRQLRTLLDRGTNISVHEIDIRALLSAEESTFAQTLHAMTKAFSQGLTPVVLTSRDEIQFASTTERQLAGRRISATLSRLVRDFPSRPSFLIAKGGITSHDILASGLQVPMTRVLGQAAPGVPVVMMPENHRWALMPYVIFPGNVGAEVTLYEVTHTLQEKADTTDTYKESLYD